VVDLGKRELIRGDKLRDLILLVYLNNKYGLGKKVDVSKLKDFIGYSRTGLATALSESVYFIREGDAIALTDAGERYVKKVWMRYYRAFNPVGYLFIFLGLILFAQWYLLTYYKILLSLNWYGGIALIVSGLLIRFALLPMSYWLLKLKKRM
jgi:hypothetical protein